MGQLSNLINDVFETTDLDPCDENALLQCLVEEVGEVSTALLVESGVKRKNISENSKEEAVDVVLAALILYRKLGGSKEHFIDYANIKLIKYKTRAKRLNENIQKHSEF